MAEHFEMSAFEGMLVVFNLNVSPITLIISHGEEIWKFFVRRDFNEVFCISETGQFFHRFVLAYKLSKMARKPIDTKKYPLNLGNFVEVHL